MRKFEEHKKIYSSAIMHLAHALTFPQDMEFGLSTSGLLLLEKIKVLEYLDGGYFNIVKESLRKKTELETYKDTANILNLCTDKNKMKAFMLFLKIADEDQLVSKKEVRLWLSLSKLQQIDIHTTLRIYSIENLNRRLEVDLSLTLN